MTYHRVSALTVLVVMALPATVGAQASHLTLEELVAFGSGDSLPAVRQDVFENLAVGAIADSSVLAIDLVGSRLVLLRFGAQAVRAVRVVGGVGSRTLGRFLAPCCAAVGPDGVMYVLDQAANAMTFLDDSLYPYARIGVRIPKGASAGGLLALEDGAGWLVGLTSDTSESVAHVGPSGAVTPRWSISRGTRGESARGSWPSLARSRDGSVLAGSGMAPEVIKASLDGIVEWRTRIPTSGVPDPLPDSAPGALRSASFRVSSVIELTDGTVVATVFRPARRHTVLAVISADGQVMEWAVYPVPIWFFGATREGLIVGTRVREFQEVVVFRASWR